MNLRFISLIVPVTTLEAKYPGGLAQCLQDLGPVTGEAVELADGLFRVSSMSPADTQVDCKHFESRGLTGIVRTDHQETWGDFCIVDSLMGPTLPCSWIVDFLVKATTQTCRDADQLDLGRVKIMPSPNFLSQEATRHINRAYR